MSAWKVILIVVVLSALFTTGLFLMVRNSDHDAEQRNRRNYDECVARGGTVILNRYNWYDGCKIAPKAGG